MTEQRTGINIKIHTVCVLQAVKVRKELINKAVVQVCVWHSSSCRYVTDFELSDEGVCSDDVQRGDSKHSVRVENTVFLQHLRSDGDGGVHLKNTTPLFNTTVTTGSTHSTYQVTTAPLNDRLHVTNAPHAHTHTHTSLCRHSMSVLYIIQQSPSSHTHTPDAHTSASLSSCVIIILNSTLIEIDLLVKLCCFCRCTWAFPAVVAPPCGALSHYSSR